MAYLHEHCYDCKRWLGRDWEEVHVWLDEFFKDYGPAHRCERHHVEGIEEVRRMWGDEAAIAATIHILVDCWGIPFQADYDQDLVEGYGQAPGATWEEAKEMLKAVIPAEKRDGGS